MGAAKVAQALAGIERRFVQHNKTVDKAIGKAPKQGSQRAQQSQAIKGIAEIGKVAAREEMRRHRQAMSNIAKEARAKVAAEKAAAKAAAREIAKQRAASDRFRRGIAGRITGSAGGAIKGIAGVAGGALALAGGFAVQDAVREQIRVTSAATGLANQAFGNAGEKRSRAEIRADVMKQIKDLDHQSGMGREKLIGGLRSYTAISGDLGGGQKLLGFMAELADAVDANVEDIGQATARVKQAVEAGGATGELAAKQTQEIMSVIAGQSKVGSVELKDLAEMIGRATSAAGKFSGGAPKLIAEMGAMAQLAVEGGAMGGAEATTATSRLPTDIIKHNKALKKLGVDIFTDKSKTAIRGPTDIIKDVLTKSGGDLTKITPIFGDESRKIFDPLAKAYNEAGGGEAGLKAIDAKLKPFLTAGLSDKDRKDSAEFARNTPERQFAKVMGEFKETVGSQLLPELTKLVPVLSQLVPVVAEITKAFVGFAKWAAENPMKGLGAIIAAKVGADLAAAGIGAAAKKGLETALNNIGGGKLAILTLAVAAETAMITAAVLATGKDNENKLGELEGGRRILDNPNASASELQTVIDSAQERKKDVVKRSAKNILAPSMGLIDNEYADRALGAGANLLTGGLAGLGANAVNAPKSLEVINESNQQQELAAQRLLSAAERLDQASAKLNDGGKRPTGI